MIPTTTERVLVSTPAELNEDIDRHTRRSVAHFAASSPHQVDERLKELDREWDVERAMETSVALGVLAGVLLTLLDLTLGLIFTAMVGLFLLWHAVFGWTPVLWLIRRAGFRAPAEIAQERIALKALRGDFQPLSGMTTPQDREDLARLEGEGGIPQAPPKAGDPKVVSEALRAAQQ